MRQTMKPFLSKSILLLVAMVLAGGVFLAKCNRRSAEKMKMTSSSAILSFVGHKVVVIGSAYDSKAGALLDEATLQGMRVMSPVLVHFKDGDQLTRAWPEHLSGKKLKIVGTLVRFELNLPQDQNAYDARIDGEVDCFIQIENSSTDIEVLPD